MLAWGKSPLVSKCLTIEPDRICRVEAGFERRDAIIFFLCRGRIEGAVVYESSSPKASAASGLENR